ncbi:VWFA and cache domain-containing protein 1 [Desmophyllum pertusum]|uniref:VWFA and cache domain-containing protein 1 n=1 Tax=Desmophyllum pertusum TaxID=174260 RepID=A0A9X0D2J9_9CNID|nr:VWFA and cache domain-containing protein 1 [Desmophyllum pertusum]
MWCGDTLVHQMECLGKLQVQWWRNVTIRDRDPALANTGMLTLTTPYLDLGGAGVVITAGRALHRGEPSHIHHTNDEVLGVMGADFPLTYFYR